MFERFTKRARATIVHAQEEAKRLGHDFLGTEHLLLGLLVDDDCFAARVLVAEGLTLDVVRAEVERIVGVGPDGASSIGDAEALASIGIDLDSITAAVEAAFGEGALDRAKPERKVGSPRFTPRAKKVMELALREALSFRHNHIGTEHLLLAIVRTEEGVGYDVIADAVSDPMALRRQVIAEINRLQRGA